MPRLQIAWIWNRPLRSALLKAGALAVLWWIGRSFWLDGFTVPTVIFYGAALYFYFYPWFRPAALAAPFLAVLFLSGFAQPNFFMIMIMGVAWFYIFSIKDFVVVDRSRAYLELSMVLFFAACLAAYTRNSWNVSHLFAAPFLLGILFYALAAKLPWQDEQGRRSSIAHAGALMGAFLLMEIYLVTTVLPLDPLLQGTLLFITATFLLFVSSALQEGRQAALRFYAIVFALASGLALAVNVWRI